MAVYQENVFVVDVVEALKNSNLVLPTPKKDDPKFESNKKQEAIYELNIDMHPVEDVLRQLQIVGDKESAIKDIDDNTNIAVANNKPEAIQYKSEAAVKLPKRLKLKSNYKSNSFSAETEQSNNVIAEYLLDRLQKFYESSR